MKYTGVLPDNILRRLPPEERARLGKSGRLSEEAIAEEKSKNEKEFQQKCVELMAQRGITVNRSRMDRKKTDVVGWPDLTFCYRTGTPAIAFPCAVECKMPGEEPEPHQKDMMEKLANEGWQVTTIWTVQDLRAFLDKLDSMSVMLGNISNEPQLKNDSRNGAVA